MLQTAVNDDIIISGFQRHEHGTHHVLAVSVGLAQGIVLRELHDLKPDGGIRKASVGRDQIQAVLNVKYRTAQMQFDIFRIVDSCQQGIRQSVFLFARGKSHSSGEIALMIVVNHQNFFTALIQGCGEIYHTGGLADTTFFICD